jgi:hypothetical protein
MVASGNTDVLKRHGRNQHSINLLVWTDHVERTPNIDKHGLFVKGNAPWILLPNTQPDVTALKLTCSAMDLIHQTDAKPVP